MVSELIFSIVGGLGLFIYGIHLMGEGLQNAAGDRLRRLLKALTKNTLSGTLLGAGITAIIQSSSATTVMVVGFVNAGLMTLTQAIGVIFGANIGTTITAQIIAFKLTAFALPAIAIGACLYLFSPKRFWKFFGLFCLGFGILFLGLKIMTSMIKPFAGDPVIQNIFVEFSKNPFLGILIGASITALFQSSSVTTGMIITLASLGLFDLQGAIPLIFGCNIGTCVTAMLASLGTTISAKRAALAHVLFNIMITLLFLPTLPFYYRIIAMTSGDIARQVANAHTLFNVLGTIVLAPFASVYAKVVTKVLPGKDTIIDTQPQFLEKHLLYTPLVAFDAAIKEVVRMTNLARGMMSDAMVGFFKENVKVLGLVPKKEAALDNLQEAVTNYLMELMQKEISPEIASKIPSLLHSVNDIERMGDHCENIMELAQRKIASGFPFSKEAETELKEMFSLVDDMAKFTISSLDNDSIEDAQKVLNLEEKVDKFTQKLRDNHINRLSIGQCQVLSGIIFLDLISNFEKIGDHLTNVAQAVLGKLQWTAKQVTEKHH
ncbi:MAG: Na/Pi cotransporter family protein [Candidatus Omnitrophica bacterium]|nr:Na/Pi cotransporter family protein [Candidatus Omnitrophota bacterium]